MPDPVVPRALALATSSAYPAVQADDRHLVDTLQQLGVQSTVCVWNDPTVDWAAFDAVLIRTIWDYFRHYADFLRWLDTLDALGVPTINASALLRWNSDKRYLLELAQHGVAIIPTQLARAGHLQEVLSTMPAQQVVVKPAISGGAWHTLRGTVGTPAFAQALAQLPPAADYLVQPFMPEVAHDGEWSLLYFGGVFSHAVLKRPAAGDYRVQGEHGGSVGPARPAPATLEDADRALAAVARLGHGDHVYVRVDGVVSAGQLLVMELEMIEPFLFLGARPEAAERLARLVSQRLSV
jgi:glutathione synthase/RimK-type ligase-like ATP-grasp enzyme